MTIYFGNLRFSDDWGRGHAVRAFIEQKIRTWVVNDEWFGAGGIVQLDNVTGMNYFLF